MDCFGENILKISFILSIINGYRNQRGPVFGGLSMLHTHILYLFRVHLGYNSQLASQCFFWRCNPEYIMGFIIALDPKCNWGQLVLCCFMLR